jgi:UDP-N-acetylglucosamine diphosphorylase / glucose-1-phosphate thymidylyltransferase / UDP-N-acetylgalactosamine diphosphorylase / glucosamine-1-phosphate N-acetyltransferase / galactosamine-1-phosphate N-acetyltransferase
MWRFFFSFTLYKSTFTLKLNFYPFTLTKTFAQLQLGAFTFEGRWKLISKICSLDLTTTPVHYFPTPKFIDNILAKKYLPKKIKSNCIELNNAVDIVKNLQQIILTDVTLKLYQKTKFTTVPNVVFCKDKSLLFLEQNTTINTCFLNTDNGPIYIGKGTTIQDGVCMKGPIYIGENCVVKMGATIYEGTVIGNNCIVGGEVKNAVLMNNSNKAHYGYLGDSIIGEWCNLGAGTTNSNLKNNVSDVEIKVGENKLNAGIKFGLLMGHYSRTAINTSFNTGTIVGVSCNIFANGLTPKVISSFSWGVEKGNYELEKAIADIEKWMSLKNKSLSKKEINQLLNCYITSK